MSTAVRLPGRRVLRLNRALHLATVASAWVLLPPSHAAAQAATAASPLLDQATKQARHDQSDDAAGWPEEALRAPEQPASPSAARVPATASVSIGEAARAASEDTSDTGVGAAEPVAAPSLRSPASPASAPAPAAAGPAPADLALSGQPQTDSATMRRIAMKLVALGFLGRADDADDPAVLSDAVRAYQSASGIAPTGTLDRDTIGRLVS
ncbi:peptidoglycan-binding domain-containing protein [Novosphingobium huizhouense]|uniref:peptidoglycan-binding domain-containing protein n=1 Tax=Novosphingobium huizhouense TaxID=2866625 RepID=UPI001CD82F5A|nr:peptidoglycan-binding domain-containing protein [Novosphingobium huizhouense]